MDRWSHICADMSSFCNIHKEESVNCQTVAIHGGYDDASTKDTAHFTRV